mgnify:CR=1 FL=1
MRSRGDMFFQMSSMQWKSVFNLFSIPNGKMLLSISSAKRKRADSFAGMIRVISKEIFIYRKLSMSPSVCQPSNSGFPHAKSLSFPTGFKTGMSFQKISRFACLLSCWMVNPHLRRPIVSALSLVAHRIQIIIVQLPSKRVNVAIAENAGTRASFK